jgi:lysylphosphatidylglycerol synthetase-like protein (DUF2156 family)
LIAGNELLLRGGAVLGKVRSPARAEAMARWREPDFAVAAATGIVALSGALLLALGVLAPAPDLTWIDPDFADLATQASQFVPSLIGAGLIVLAIGLSQRVNLAWGATIVLLRRASGCGSPRCSCWRSCCWRRSAPASIATRGCSAGRCSSITPCRCLA